MNLSQLYQTIILSIKEVKSDHEFTEMQVAILEEMCEHVLNSKSVDHSNTSEMVMISLNSFEASYQLMKAMISGVINSCGNFKINFRGRDFYFDKNTHL